MQKIEKILCATDLSEVSDRLFSWGAELCLGFDASFSVFHAIPPPRGFVTRQIEFDRLLPNQIVQNFPHGLNI